MRTRRLLSLASALTLRVSAHFVLTDSYTGRDFLNGWKWEDLDDPTHGRVNYTDQHTALATNLTYGTHISSSPRPLNRHETSSAYVATDTKFVIRADPYNIVSPTARGRNSVRISTWKAWDESVTVLDLQHMPEGCGTWPAFWSLSQQGPWPHGGEIDIIEGTDVNLKPTQAI